MKTNTQFKKKLLSMVLCLALVLSYLPLDVFAVEGDKTVLDITQGDITINTDSVSGFAADGTAVTAHDPDGYIIQGNGTATGNVINVTGGTHSIDLNEVIIGSDDQRTNGRSPLTIADNATVTLNLVGENTLGAGWDGYHTVNIVVGAGATLNIDGSGSLKCGENAWQPKLRIGESGKFAVYGGTVTLRSSYGETVHGEGTLPTFEVYGGTVNLRADGNKIFHREENAKYVTVIVYGGELNIYEKATGFGSGTLGIIGGKLTSSLDFTLDPTYINVHNSGVVDIAGPVAPTMEQNPDTTNWKGMVKAQGNVTIYGDFTQPYDLTIAADKSLTLAHSTTKLTVPSGKTLTVNGSITNNGSIVNEGTFTSTTTVPGAVTINGGSVNVNASGGAFAGEPTLSGSVNWKVTANDSPVLYTSRVAQTYTQNDKVLIEACTNHEIDYTQTVTKIDNSTHKGTCKWCGYSEATEAHTGHYSYSANGNTITASCACGYSLTAELRLKANADLTYTGSAIEPMEMVYPAGWPGATDAAIQYTNNINASTVDNKATATIIVEGKTATNSFAIIPSTMAVIANGYTGTFDGQAHGITVNAPAGATIKYGTAEGIYDLDASPTQTGVGSITVYYQVIKENYNTVTGSAAINITAKPLTDGDVTISFAPASGIYTGEDLTPNVTVKWGDKILAAGTDYILSWSENSIVNPGTYTATVTAVDGSNFSSSKTADFVVGNAALTGVSVSQAGTLTYDGKAQTPTVNATATTVNGQPFTYTYRASENESYGQMPAFTNAGTYTVYYKATAPNHNDVEGSFTVTVNKQTVTPPAIASKKYSGENQIADIADTALFEVTENAGGTNCGSYDVVLTLKDSANYRWAEEIGTIGGENGKNLTLSFAITKATANFERPYPYTLIYTGENQNLLMPSHVTGGQMLYSTDGTTWSTDIPQGFSVGRYTVYYKVVGDSNHTDSEIGYEFANIGKRPITVTANDAHKTYGDADPALTWTVTYGTVLAADPISVGISRANGENVGTYAITVSQSGGANPNYDITFVNGTFTINKAPLTIAVQGQEIFYGDEMGDVLVNDEGFKFSDDFFDLGQEHVVFTSTYSRYDDAGTYTISTSGWESDNYEISYTSGTLTVKSKPITVTIVNKTSVYGKTIAELTATTAEGAIVNDDTNVYSLATTATSTANVGTYSITGTTLDANYDITFVDGTYTITKAQAVCTAPTAVSGLVYNKSAQTLIAAGSTNDGTMVYSLEKEGEYTSELPQATATGTYYVWYKVIGDGNHIDSAPVSVEIKIDKADPSIGTVTAGVVNDTLETSAIVLTRTNTNVAGNLIVDAGQTLVLGENEIKYTFVPTDTTNYKTVTGTVTVTVADTIAPTGTVTIATNNWTNFLNNITFGLFFKETQTVSVVASDNLSGVAKIEYIESKTAMDLDEVKAATQWTQMGSGSISVTLEDTKQFVYYIRITDKSGNIFYLSTDGAEYDTSAPVIAGVNNGVTYYTTQRVTINDKNIGTITLNGEAVTGPIALAGDKEATYTIVATDKVGNTTTVTVKMAPIADIAESMGGMTSNNVTSDDKTVLQTIVNITTELLKDEELPAEEKAALEKAKADAEALLIVIENADKAADTENTDKVEDVTPDNVTPEDKTNLEKAKTDLEKALDDNGGNYTAEEKKAIEDELKRMDEALKVIENVEVVEDVISELPATVEPDDEKTVAKIEAAKKFYNELSDYEKSLVVPETKEKLDKLTNGIVAYDIVKGDGDSWTQGTDGSVDFTVNGPISKFSGIKIDGKAVDAQYYDVKAGSTIITLKASYLETLAAGEHSITVIYTDGETSGTFNVQAKSTTPATGDDSYILLWTTMLLFSIAAMTVLTVYNKQFAYKAKFVRK